MSTPNSTRRKPVAQFRRSGEVTLLFPYDRGLVDTLKHEIPSHARSYDPALKAWTIQPPYTGVAIEALLAAFPGATIEKPGHRPEPEPIRRTDQTYAVLHLLPTAPRELVDAAFRVLARRLHPDTAGGDGEQMRELNDAYAQLKARVSA